MTLTEADERFLQAYMGRPCETQFEESPYTPFFDNLMEEIEENYRDRIVGVGDPAEARAAGPQHTLRVALPQ